jgi:hypothetical protein
MVDNVAYHHTHKAPAGAADRQWNHVIASETAAGKSRVQAIIIANGVVKNHPAGSGTHSAHVGQDH